MDYLKMEGKEKSGLRPDDGEGLALMQGHPGSSSGPGYRFLNLLSEESSHNKAYWSPSYTALILQERPRYPEQAVLTNAPIPSTSEIPAPSSRLGPTIGDCPHACRQRQLSLQNAFPGRLL